MSIFDSLFSTGNKDTDKLLDALQARYFASEVGYKVADSLWESDDEKLDREQKRLSIAASKKSLGLPYSDDDYENAENNGLSLGQKAMFGKHITNSISSPAFLDRPASRGLMETRFPTNSTEVGALDELLSGGSALRKGSSYVGKLRGIGKYFKR